VRASVCPSCPSNKGQRLVDLGDLDRINLDLLCLRWLPHCCHVGCRDVITDVFG
jgi:hypothetical protein